jgi:hypothetical protein
VVELFGLFMLSPEGEVCFAQIGVHHDLKAIRVVAGPSAIAVLSDDTEEMFATEINPVILSALQKHSEILVAHVGEDGKAVTEYTVPLSLNT